MNESAPMPGESAGASYIDCPCCHGKEYTGWARELGYSLVRCGDCGLLFVNPAPSQAEVDAGVRQGKQAVAGRSIDVRSRRIAKKVDIYKAALKDIYSDLWQRGAPICWVDLGSGYGETLEAVSALAPSGSRLIGVEPMVYKAIAARERGLEIVNDMMEGEFNLEKMLR